MVADLERILNKKSYLNDIKKIDSLNFEMTFILRNGWEIPLVVYFDTHFPSTLPIVKINNEKFKVPKIPHVLKSGTICFLETEGVIWNDIPEVTIDFIFERVERVLLNNKPINEYHKEFSYYFGTLEEKEFAVANLKLKSEIVQLNVWCKKRVPIAFLDQNQESNTIIEKFFDIKLASKTLSKGIYIPLDKVYKDFVPQFDRFWNNDEITNLIIDHLSEEKLKKLENFSFNKSDYYYILEIPLLSGNKVLIGLWYKKTDFSLSKKVNPIIDKTVIDSFKVIPIEIYQIGDGTLIERGGGIKSDSKILLVGCGSVGSDLLFLLARSGLKNFTLVDNDKLTMVNSYRHFLGMDKAVTYKSKVKLLKEEIQSRYPNVEIVPFESEILDAIENRKVKLEDYDLIIVAIGNPNIERKLNKIILESKTPAIFTWVEAYGLGGHALLVNNKGKGCYECLIEDDLQMKSSFAAKSDKPFVRNINGCGGTYTPYGSTDSMQTALIASRLVLRYLNNDVNGNPLISWKGSAKEFRLNGFETSDRYELPYEQLIDGTQDYVSNYCPVCHK
jgi:molybdopterin/thiamine biosynthesis adenylyltransferase